MSRNKLPLSKAFWLIFLSMFSVTSIAAVYLFIGKQWKTNRLNDPKYLISVIVQTGPEKKALDTQYLAELIGLSSDRKTNIYAFDEKEAERKLTSCPLIKTAYVRKIKPNTVYINYSIREAFAVLSDYENVAVDEKGYTFFIKPFIQLEDQCEIYLGLANQELFEQESLPTCVDSLQFNLAKKLIRLFENPKIPEWLKIKRIDVSKAFSKSYGQKEIILYTEESLDLTNNQKEITYIFPKIIRLNVNEYAEQLGNLIVLCQKMRQDYKKQVVFRENPSGMIKYKPKVLDFRIPQLAYIDENK